MGTAVNHPDHYQLGDGVEMIDIIKAVTKKLEGIEAFDIGNALKYLGRWKEKGGVQDLEKAVWYIQHLIDHEQSEVKKAVDQLTNQMTGGVS